MRALILNSGIGKRMGELTKTKNKCVGTVPHPFGWVRVLSHLILQPAKLVFLQNFP